ncbi:MAG TPA: phosphoglucosamine mutase [Candidatus Limnocylindrales bacterium]|jgi:phosphoglucosamine mutase|nr:phosphoglucosamine mutase [Candidatus Limnocylindrales bacterium]
MTRLFGTDGIRGIANIELKPTLAYALGRATAHKLVGRGGSLVVGQDTRRSGDMFVAAIAAGATSLGADVRIAGCVPTPALAFLAGTGQFEAGIMVSASHNPADDNGLKVLDRQGLKLDDGIEDEIEQLIWRTEELGSVGNAEIGRSVLDPSLLERYRTHRLELAGSVQAAGVRIVLDCANGSGGITGPDILRATGASVEVIHNDPDGININVGSGATAPASLAEAVRERGADVGFALDGDADRLIAVDAAGRIVDGDQVLGILALDRLERGVLAENALVVSVLSNGGLQAAVEAAGGQVIRTPVGDKYILDGMQVSGAGLGGEKSGHVIVLEHTTSGDGIVTALEVLRVMARAGLPLADLARRIPMLPQQQRAVKARHKDQWEGDPAIQRSIRDAERRLGDGGRVLVRPSGTEPALRVMVEGPDAALVAELADSIATLAGERLN